MDNEPTTTELDRMDTTGDEGNDAIVLAEDGAEEEIDRPTKLLRIAAMVKGLLGEVEVAELDEGGRNRLAAVHERSVEALRDVLSDDLLDELDDLSIGGLRADGAPSGAELRVAQAQLAGWLEGLFHGIQAAMVGQQAQAKRRLLQQQLGAGAQPEGRREPGSGQYL